MKTIKSVNVGSFALYGAVLAAFWTFVFGVYYWLLGWIFGAQSWYIDMNLGNWTVYTMTTFGLIFLKAFIVGAGGALGRRGDRLDLQHRGRHDGRPQDQPAVIVRAVSRCGCTHHVARDVGNAHHFG